MQREEQKNLLNDLVRQVAAATLLLKNTRDKMLKGDIFDKRSFEHLMSASDIGTHYLYLLYMIRTLNDENGGVF